MRVKYESLSAVLTLSSYLSQNAVMMSYAAHWSDAGESAVHKDPNTGFRTAGRGRGDRDWMAFARARAWVRLGTAGGESDSTRASNESV